MAKLLPVQPGFFPELCISTLESRRYGALAKDSLSSIRVCDEKHDAFKWIPCESKDGVNISKSHYIEQRGSQEGTPCLLYRGVIQIPGLVTEVMNILSAPVTMSYRKLMHDLHGDCFLDGMILHTIQGNVPDVQYANMAVKWAAFKVPNTKFEAYDYCFLESSGIERSKDGRLQGYCICESIERPEVPSLETIFGLKRGNYRRTGLLIEESLRPNIVHVTSLCQTDASGSQLSVAVAESWMKQRICLISKLAGLIDKKRLSSQTFVARWQWIPDDKRKECHVCYQNFTYLRKRHHCRQCGEVVCSKCAPFRDVDVSSLGTTQIRVCNACIVRARKNSHERLRLDMNAIASSETTRGPAPARSTSNSYAQNNNSSNSNNNSSNHGTPTTSIRPLSTSTGTNSSVDIWDYQTSPSQRQKPTSFKQDMHSLASMIVTQPEEKQPLSPIMSNNETTSVEIVLDRNEIYHTYHTLNERLNAIRSTLAIENHSPSRKDSLNNNQDRLAAAMASMNAASNAVAAAGEAAMAAGVKYMDILDPENSELSGNLDLEMNSILEYGAGTPPHHPKDQLKDVIDDIRSSSTESESEVVFDDNLYTHTNVERNTDESFYNLMDEIRFLRKRAERGETEMDLKESQVNLIDKMDTMERQVNYWVKQSGNVTFDPVVIERRISYRAMVNELHEIMGLPCLRPDPIVEVQDPVFGVVDDNKSMCDERLSEFQKAADEFLLHDHNRIQDYKEQHRLPDHRLKDHLISNATNPIPLGTATVATTSTSLGESERKEMLESRVSLVREGVEMMKKGVFQTALVIQALNVLVRVFSSLYREGGDGKYQTLKRSDHYFSQHLAGVPGVSLIMKAAGYEELPRRFSLPTIDLDILQEVVQVLEASLEELSHSL